MKNLQNCYKRVSEDGLIQVEIPNAVENLQLPSPELLSYYKDLDNRVIWIDHDIDQSLLEYSKSIIKWNAEDKGVPVEDRKHIKILIYSYGGDLDSCESFIDTILASTTPVDTYNMGVAMSAGGFIFLAGDKRYCLKTATFMIHSGSAKQTGTHEQIQALNKDYEHSMKILKDFVLSRTNINSKVLTKKWATDWYIYSDEQVELGITHTIIKSLDEVI